MSTVYRGGMRIGAGVEWGIHCCVVISRADGPVPAQKLAEYHDVSRTYLAKALQDDLNKNVKFGGCIPSYVSK